jgi:YVTN family beta-propeller protein
MRLRLVACVVGLWFASFVSYAGTAKLVVVEKGAHSVAIIDAGTNTVLASVDVGGVTGHEVATSPDGRRAYVPIYGDSGVGKPGTDGRTMAVIDVASQRVAGTVDFGHGVRPHLPVIGPKDGLVYVTTELDHSVTVVDPKTLKIVGSIPTGQAESHMLALSHDGLRGYTANVGPGTVSVLDIPGRKLLKVIPVAGSVQRISISTDDRFVFTADQTAPQMDVIDTATEKVISRIDLPDLGYGGMATPDGKWLLAAMPGASKVAVISLAEMKMVRTLDVPAGPQAVLVRPDGKAAYVSCDGPNQVAVIDLAEGLKEWKVSHLISTGKSTDGMSWAAGN